MTGIPPVRIHDDLATGEPGITLGTADNKLSGRVDEIFGRFATGFQG